MANRPINWPVILTGRQASADPVPGVPAPAPGGNASPAARPAAAIPNRSGGNTPDRKRGRDSAKPRPSPGTRGPTRPDKGGVLDVTIGSGGDGQ
ncbi:MAG TPA: hypothetical protein VLK32_04475 [Bacillota bacterium]|nr:hypothetical protein [Bacillota bacterium]